VDHQTLGHIYLIDDDASIRRALHGTLDKLGFTVSAFEDADTFLKHATPVSPAVILLDMRMPSKSGVELQAELLGIGWRTPIIFISGESLPAQIVLAMKQGAADFLLKPFSMDALLRAINSGLERDRADQSELNHSLTVQQKLKLLTPREKEVCCEMVSGRSNKEIAHASNSAPSTVKLHRARILKKMQVESLGDLIALLKGIDLKSLTLRQSIKN
jgi:two-component system response regulator FixJ